MAILPGLIVGGFLLAANSYYDLDTQTIMMEQAATINTPAGKAISFNSSDDSNFTVTGSGKNLTLSAAGGGAQKLTINSAGTGTDALSLNATAGGIDINSGSIDLSTQTADITLNNAVDALNFDSNTISIDALNNRVGIGTTTPLATLHINGTDGLIIPVGTTVQRPSPLTTGIIRYNTTTSQFEGYDGSYWGSLGGVLDVDQDTYVSAENTPGADNDQLRFFTANIERLRISTTGGISIGSTYVSTDPGNGNMIISGSVGVGTATGVNSKLTFAADTTAAGGILFGADTNLYRVGANILKTDDSLIVAGSYVDVEQIRSITGQLTISGVTAADSPILFRNSNAALDNYATRLVINAHAAQGAAGITSYEDLSLGTGAESRNYNLNIYGSANSKASIINQGGSLDFYNYYTNAAGTIRFFTRDVGGSSQDRMTINYGNSGSAGITMYEPLTLSGVGLTVGSDIVSDTADTDSLGSTSKEWLNAYIGDAGGLYFGLAQDIYLERSGAGVLMLTTGAMDFNNNAVINVGAAGNDFGASNALVATIFSGSITPSGADTLNLGSTAAEWQNLYVGDAGKIYLGLGQDTSLNRSAANALTITASSGVTLTAGLTVGSDI
ncbi:MAG: hypothetical protein V1872_09920, partial [bacterium]